MKKSIVAMLSITALATVANADPFAAPTGTHFEGIQNGAAFYPSNDDAGNTAGPNFFWYAATNGVACEAQFGVYTNADYMGSSYSGDRPATPVATTITDRCLSIDTEGERLIRRMGAADQGRWSNPDFVQYDVTSAIYFDSLVQFTVNEDEAPTIQTGDKLAVWLKGGDTTNLVITAGYLNYAVGVDPVTRTNYVVQTTTDIVPNTWYRLTIEAIPLITGETAGEGRGYLGFRVRINGSYVTCEDSRGATEAVLANWTDQGEAVDISGDQGIFPSLVRGGGEITESDTLSCVAFEGTGALDDFVFTTSDPFAGQQQDDLAIVIGGVTNFFTEADMVAFTNAFKAGNTLVLPAEGWSFSDGQILHGSDVFATVPGYYNVVDGAISLNETIVRPVFGTKPASGEDPAVEPITVGATTVTLNITNGKAGLYYGVRKYTALGGASTDTWNQTAQAADGNVILEVAKPADETAAFYQVIVNDALPAQSGN
jgi:hypothetical protein